MEETDSRFFNENELVFKLLAMLVNDIKLDRHELPESELSTDLICSAYISEYFCANLLLMLEMLSGNDKVLDRLLVTAFTDPPPPWTSWAFTSRLGNRVFRTYPEVCSVVTQKLKS
jgi:hypothetical protein